MNFDDNTHITLSEELLSVMNDVVDTELLLPKSILNTLERWSRSYMRAQIPHSSDSDDQKYQFNVLSIVIELALILDGLHPLSVANKKHLVVSGNDVHFDYLTTISPSQSKHSIEETEESHLLILSLKLQSVLYISRSLDEEFVTYVKNCVDNMNGSDPFFMTTSLPGKRYSAQPLSESSSSGSLGSQIVKVSDISISIHYRFVSPLFAESMSVPLKLFPMEISIGLLSLSSKSSVIDGVRLLSWPGGSDTLPGKNEKFNIRVEGVNCVVSSELLEYALQALMKNMCTVEKILIKLRMIAACSKYQLAVAFYTLLQKVG